MSETMGAVNNFDQDFEKNPSKFGFCTFKEFRKNKAKWSPSKEQVWEVIDKGSEQFKMKIRRYRYFYEHYKCDSLEQVQRHFEGQGLSSNDIVFCPKFLANEHGGNDCHVYVYSKAALKKRMGWT